LLEYENERWECPKCERWNKNDVGYCPTKVEGKQCGGTKKCEIKSGGWAGCFGEVCLCIVLFFSTIHYCFHLAINNFYSFVVCCSTLKPPKEGSWKCDVCLVSNTPAAKKCLVCDAAKPGEEGKSSEKDSSPAKPAALKGSFGVGGFTFGSSSYAQGDGSWGGSFKHIQGKY